MILFDNFASNVLFLLTSSICSIYSAIGSNISKRKRYELALFSFYYRNNFHLPVVDAWKRPFVVLDEVKVTDD